MFVLNLHLKYIKLYMFYILLSFIFTFGICYMYNTEILYKISVELLKYEKGFIYTGITDAFFIYLKLSLLLTLILINPIITYFFLFFFNKSIFI